jgi:hypothetical protein
MRQDDRSSAAGGAGDGDGESGRTKGRRRRPKGAGGFGPGAGFMPPFGPQQFMQMLPLMMAMGGGGMPGMGLANTQIQLVMWMVETWIDYLGSMQEVLERALERLHDMNLAGGWMPGGDGGDEGGGKEW